MKGSTRKYVDRKCLLCSTKFVYIYIYIYIYIQPLRFEKEITQLAVEIKGKFTRPTPFSVNNFTSPCILVCAQYNKLQKAIVPRSTEI